MYGEYGYIEEGDLGKPYNFRLLKRLAHYAIPYRNPIAIALSLTIMATLLELALPYLTKIAIDRYIMSSWYRVRVEAIGKGSDSDFYAKYGHLLKRGAHGSDGFISHVNVKKIDPAILHTLREKGIISSQRFYRFWAEGNVSDRKVAGDMSRLMDGSVVIPLESLHALSREDILKIRDKDVEGVGFVALLLLAFLLVSFGLGYAQYYLLEMVGQKIMHDIRLELFQRMQAQAVRFFDRNPVGRLVTRVTNDVENLNEMFKSVIITVFKDIFIVTGILAVILYLNWRLALVCFTLIPVIFGLTLLFSYMAREAFRELRQKVAKINAFLQERIAGMRIIQLFTREAFQMGRFAGINRENYLAGIRQIRVFAVFMPLMELFSAFAVALLIWYGGGKVIGEQMTLGSLVAFVSYIQMFFRPIRDIAEKYNIMQSAMASTERIIEFMDHDEEIPDPDHPVRPREEKGHVEFRGVSFGYQQNQPVLQGVDFELKPGEMVAVVGATGGGKTTVVSLLERFYEVGKGRILVDGIDIDQWSKGDLRRHLGLVMQDVFIFSGNLRDNITLGREDIRPEMIERAVTESNSSGLIARLEHGLAQEIGEGGANLSAGERQLISFARALAHSPRVLILDEATSSVDPETEGLIQEAILKMTRRRTTLVVAHRLATVQRADRILVMHHGRIQEQGTHDELMALGGIYYKLNRFREA